MGEGHRKVLTPARNASAEPRNQRKPRTGKWVEQLAIAEAVPRGQPRATRQHLVDPRIRLIHVVAKRGRGNEVGRAGSVRRRIEGGDGASNRTLKERWNDAPREGLA